MHISSMTIDNYRTFRHVVFQFDRQVNYMVGDNNIGKSNFLCLLKWISHGYGFREGDFLDADYPIEIRLVLAEEAGGETAELYLVQAVQEVVPRLFDRASGRQLPLEYLRCLFYIDFSLCEMPRRMMAHASMGELLSLLQHYFAKSPAVISEVEAMFREKGIGISLPKEHPSQAALSLLETLFGERGDGSSYQRTACLMARTALVLLMQMMKKKASRAISFEHMVTTDAKGRRFLSLLVSVDEPELHLHPYLQRAMLSFCHMILSNEEPFFLKLVQTLLGVDGLSGQLFVVTHSTDALVNDYRQIIRLYWDEKKLVQAACGASFHFDREIEKHLIMHFPEVKEALYARAAVLVEGETEYGSFAGFAKTLGIRFDHYGICLINARGESSISKIASLIRRFHVPVVSLYDRDVMGEHKKSAGVFYTDYICYEMDVVKACLSRNGRRLLDAVIADITEGGNLVSSALVKKAGAKLAIPKGYYPPRKLSNINPRDEKALEFYYFAWLYGNKGVIIGRSLADHLGKDFIPPAFVQVILAAVGASER